LVLLIEDPAQDFNDVEDEVLGFVELEMAL
jgi:hypothetical protein